MPMENHFPNKPQPKIQEYIERIKKGASKESIIQGLPPSFINQIEAGLSNLEKRNPPVNYIKAIVDDEFIRKNLLPNGGLRMEGGQANWNGEVDLMQYVISDKLSPQYIKIAKEKIEKLNSGQERTYQHEAHHIRNRENGLTPHIAAENLREFLVFRVLDELSAFTTGELYNQEVTAENILKDLQIAEQKIINSYYSQSFQDESDWYISKNKTKPGIFSRDINQQKYHKVMRQYFQINGHDTLAILQKNSTHLSKFTEITNNLILKLDALLNSQINKK